MDNLKIKYVDSKVVFEEIPDKVTLAITISNCPFHCKGCHSDYLRQDIGKELTIDELEKLIKENKGINCILFLGDGINTLGLMVLSKFVKEKYPNISTAIYSGYDDILSEYRRFDYVKTGKWIEELGPINKETTNQRLYRLNEGKVTDITYLFWKRK